jgi:SagB-type dehydrogenase family enzyme
MANITLQQSRDFLKDNIRLTIDFSKTDQSKGHPPPPIEKPFSPDGKRIDLIAKEEWQETFSGELIDAIHNRQSHRHFKDQTVTLEELSFLLWATQGIQQILPSGSARRTVPSAGCRHALETYLCVLNVAGLDVGIYRYLPAEHQLLFEVGEQDLPRKLVEGTYGQLFTGKAAVTFVWTTIPYRMEWRYDIAAHKVILLDAGHVCQNLYLACEAIGAGTCAIAAYHQELMDQLLKIDGRDEFTIYMAPVGKV